MACLSIPRTLDPQPHSSPPSLPTRRHTLARAQGSAQARAPPTSRPVARCRPAAPPSFPPRPSRRSPFPPSSAPHHPGRGRCYSLSPRRARPCARTAASALQLLRLPRATPATPLAAAVIATPRRSSPPPREPWLPPPRPMLRTSSPRCVPPAFYSAAHLPAPPAAGPRRPRSSGLPEPSAATM